VTVWERLPWLIDLYRGHFRQLYEEAAGRRLHPTEDQRYAVVMNVQEGGDRYECHVDTNPIEALLYVTDHPRGTGGELVVANNENAASVEEVDEDCSILYPISTRRRASWSSSTPVAGRTTCERSASPACGWRSA